MIPAGWNHQQEVRMVLKSIGVMSAAKVVGVLYAVMGLLTGVIFGAVFALIPTAMAADGGDVPAWLAPMFGFGAIVFMPIVYGIMGFVGGAVAAAIYNALAGIIGGLELRLESPTRA
jgi:hypothetical protein